MFGAPDLVPDSELERLEECLAGVPETSDEELPWPLGRDTRSTFFLDERVSPRAWRWTDRSAWLAISVSLLLHLLVLSQLMHGSALKTILAALEVPPRPVLDEEVPAFFEMVELPDQKEEPPSRRNAPGSDMNRRAHGGVGAPSDRPGSQGNTPELRLEPPGAGAASGTAGTGELQIAGKGEAGEGESKGASRGKGEGTEPQPTPAVTSADAGLEPLRLGTSGGGQERPVLRGLGGIGPGSIGGSIPDRKGGRVDLGPLSFDTQWYNWGPYAAEMLRRIRYHWQIPEIARLGVGGVVRIHFFIERNGRVTGLEIEMPSPHPPMDFAARDAILNASPLPPLPADLVGIEREGVTITFYYNTPVPEGEYTG
ncbi:MAG TPA: energy transducer TonB [Thermoanaerobaculaceae bacterium]|nr:energy transducer TonB [Thermoanaerobaculaceae bacterium]HRS17321.1 energy transducer TonB [Thermoanaerobaculaceae bacterium]